MDQHRKKTIRKPMQRTLLLASIAFFVLLSSVLLAIAYAFTSSSLYARYDNKLSTILTHIEKNTDADDLAKCIKTGRTSEKYRDLQSRLNGVIDDFGLEYLYIVIPTKKYMINVCSATSEEERAAGETDMKLLEKVDAYTPKTLTEFRSYWDNRKICFFEEDSDYGYYYTGIKPLRDSKGETVALMCADLSVKEIKNTLNEVMLVSIGVIAAICILGCLTLLIWLRRSVTKPILSLEKSAREYAQNTKMLQDFTSVSFRSPQIETPNEIQALAETISDMTLDTHKVAEELISAQVKVSIAEAEARDAAKIAELKDTITSLLNNMPGLTFAKDAKTGVYLACNQAFARYAHKDSPDEVVGLTDAQIFDSVTASHFVDDDRRALSMDEPYVFYEDVPDAAGNPRNFQTTKLKYYDTNGRLCTLGMCVDVTELVRIKQENIQMKEAYEGMKKREL